MHYIYYYHLLATIRDTIGAKIYTNQALVNKPKFVLAEIFVLQDYYYIYKYTSTNNNEYNDMKTGKKNVYYIGLAKKFIIWSNNHWRMCALRVVSFPWLISICIG